jgi:hypothetical protein
MDAQEVQAVAHCDLQLATLHPLPLISRLRVTGSTVTEPKTDCWSGTPHSGVMGTDEGVSTQAGR